MWQSLTINRRGWPLVGYSIGEGHVVLMLPSLGRSATDFRNVGELLAMRGHRVLALEFRGCGGSGGPLAGLTLDDYADDVECSIEALGLTRLHLVGAPFGSRVVRRLLDRPSPRIASATVVGTGGSISLAPEVVAEARRFMAGLGKEPADVLAGLARRLYFSPASGEAGWPQDEWLSGWSIEPMMAQRAALHASAQSSSATIEKPLLILQGRDDVLSPAENASRLKNEVGALAELVLFENAGHMLILERPGEVAAAIAGFIARQVGILDRSH
jgi:pimeloyl-ACP methyl ester carboxylesterase